jgi:hypothetical protein
MAAVSSDDAELNLYDDLMAFTVLTPEQQCEMSIPCVETEREEEVTEDAPVVISTGPSVSDPPPPAAAASTGIARATISIYKSPEAGASSNQGFIVLDAEELLSDEPSDNAELDEILSDEHPDDAQLLETDGFCVECDSEVTTNDIFCPSCGSVLPEN